jgi:peroxidase
LANFWENFFGRGNPLIDALADLLDDLKPASKFEGLKFLEHRSPDGHNNDGDNDDSNDVGTHESAFVRISPAMYGADHFFSHDLGHIGTADGGTLVNQNTLTDPDDWTVADPLDADELPHPRDISNAVMDQGTEDIPNAAGLNEFMQFFGQMLTHDMAEAALGPVAPDFAPALGPGQGLPFPIFRTPFEAGTGTDAGNPREQINEETSFLDLSNVYGNRDELLEMMRADLPGGGQSAYLLVGDDGMLPTFADVAEDTGLTLLEVLERFTTANFGGLPDPADFAPGGDNEGQEEELLADLYFIGDNRVGQTPLLVSQHLLWVRNHNHWVAEIEAKHPDWTQDQIFNAAQALNIAEWQHVVYDEYLVKLLGEDALAEYEGYNSSVDPSIINEFSTVAFRFGHDQSSQEQKPLNEDGSVNNIAAMGGVFTLAAAFAAGGDALRSSEDFDSWLRGQMSAYTQEIDGLVVDGNRNALFGISTPGGPITADLTVFDTERGRDHGVWNYNNIRDALGLSTYSTFDEYAADNPLMFAGPDGAARLQALKDVYGGNDQIHKLDAIIGGLMEDAYMDSQLGQTFTMIVTMQFENLRDGDRLFYENQLADNPDLLAMIESTSLADIIERNSDIDHVYHDAFLSHNRIAAENGQLEGTEDRDLAIGSDYSDVIHTYGDDDDIYGGKARDTIYAGAGNDLVSGEEGNDIMYGEEGYDTFAFEYNSGKDKVMDFNVLEDKVDVSGYHFASMDDVEDAMFNTWGGVVLDFDDGNYVKLMGVKSYELTADNFILDGYETAMA